MYVETVLNMVSFLIAFHDLACEAPTLVTRTTKNVSVLGIFARMSENAVSLKLLPFWATEPQIWFAQAETQFALQKIIADDTKYFLVLSAFDQATSSSATPPLANPGLWYLKGGKAGL